MNPRLAKTIAELDDDFKLLDDYMGRGNCIPTYAVIVPSIPCLIQALIDNSEMLNPHTRVGRFQIDNLGKNYVVF